MDRCGTSEAGAELAVTLDTDWAPEFAIDLSARILRDRGVRATWFVTHASPAIDRLRAEPLFEVGLHPNFLPGSSHGDTPEAVLTHCLSIAPEARCLRTHGLVQSTALLDLIIRTTRIVADATIFLPDLPHLCPLEYYWAGRSLWRVPVCFEDDYEMERPAPDFTPQRLLHEPGLKVLSFHPIHVLLNSRTTDGYRRLKRRCPELSRLTPEIAEAEIGAGRGARTLFEEVADHLAERGGGRTISDLVPAGPRG